MNRCFQFCIVLVLIICQQGYSQDEGPITKKARVVTKANTIFFGIGTSIATTGSYGAGIHIQAGLLKRMNRFVSIGPFMSYSTQKYNNSKGNSVFVETGGYEIRKNRIEGGGLGILSAGAALRFDFIPNERVKKISPYANVKPFLLLSSRQSLTANSEVWYRDESTDVTGLTWYYSGTTEPLSGNSWNAKTEFAGGVAVGLGVDFFLSSDMSLFFQTGIGFTTPISYIDTGKFNTTLTGYQASDYPLAKGLFIPATLSVGVSYKF